MQPVFAAAPLIAGGQPVCLLTDHVPQALGIHGRYSSRRRRPAAVRTMLLDFLAKWFLRWPSVT